MDRAYVSAFGPVLWPLPPTGSAGAGDRRIGQVQDRSEDALDAFVRRTVRHDATGEHLPDGVAFGCLAWLDQAGKLQQAAVLNAPAVLAAASGSVGVSILILG